MFFDLSDDMLIPGRWVLGALCDSQGRRLNDPWQFGTGRTAQYPERVRIKVALKGMPLEFSLTGLAIVVVHVRAAEIFHRLAPDDIQLIPVDVDGQPDQYLILNPTRLVDCIDDKASKEILRWKPEDGRPEKVGKYRDVYGMRIDPSRVGDAKVFRTWGWSVAMIVSEEIKEALEAARITGTQFVQV